jgi:hypothetical protein
LYYCVNKNLFAAVVVNQCSVCRLISELEERVELVSQEIASLEGVDRKATEISERYLPYPVCNQYFAGVPDP